MFNTGERTVATIGLPGHGKTVFLASLFWDSFFALSESLSDTRGPYTVRALNARADAVFYGNAQLLHERLLPPANPRAKPEPARLEFSGIPNTRRRFWQEARRTLRLAFYDIAGEAFYDDASTLQYAGYLADADDLIFLFDPTRPDFSALAAARLVDRVCRVAPDSGRKNLIIALSKIDQLRHQDEWVDTVNRFWPDAPPTPTDLSHYLTEMESLSQSLRLWWRDPARQAHNLINALPAATRFCALSSLGHTPVHEDELRLTTKPEPFRVRDPLFWIFRAAGML